MIRSSLTIALLAITGTASAAPLACALPDRLETVRADGPDARNPVRDLPIASYTLALSWSPQHCRGEGGRISFQCSSGNRFGLVLHGLWPDGATKTWPQYCRPVALLDEREVRRNLCATPSPQLLQHEWAKHGSCMNIPASAYFDRARGLYERLRWPDLDRLSRRPLTVGQFKDAFARANRGVVPVNAIRVTVTGGRWLDELWLCLDTRFRYRRCTAAQDGGVPNARKLRIWRVNGT